MATVKNPLNSLSASGSINNTQTYHRAGGRGVKTIPRQRGDKSFDAQYPSAIVTGRGVVRLKPQARPDLRRRQGRAAQGPARPADLRRLRFANASTVAAWLVRNNLVVAASNPANMEPPPPPWWDQHYLQRGRREQQLKFPGQPPGRTVAWRVETTGTKSPVTFLMRQLLSRRLVRLDVTLTAWRNLTLEQQMFWATMGNAPWDELPLEFEFDDRGAVDRRFINVWIQAAYLIANFELEAGWLERGLDFAVWQTPFRRAPNDPIVTAWERWLSTGESIRGIESVRWSRGG